MEEALKAAVEVLRPLVETLLIAALSVYIPVIAAKVNKSLKLENESLVRDALHAAAERGMAYARQRLGGQAGTAALIAEATAYVRQNSPDSLKKLSVDEAQLNSILRTKMR